MADTEASWRLAVRQATAWQLEQLDLALREVEAEDDRRRDLHRKFADEDCRRQLNERAVFEHERRRILGIR